MNIYRLKTKKEDDFKKKRKREGSNIYKKHLYNYYVETSPSFSYTIRIISLHAIFNHYQSHYLKYKIAKFINTRMIIA